MPAIARTAIVLFLAAATGAASAAQPGAAVPLPPPPAGTTLSRSARTILVAGKAGIASPLGNGGENGAMLQVEAATPWRTTSSGVALSLALPLRTFLPTKGEHSGLESGASGVELTPTLRASLPLGRSRTSLRTEAGLGVVSRWTWAQVDVQYVGRRTETDRSTSAVLRMGLALDWAVRPALTLAVEPVSLGFDFEGNADWVFAVGAAYRL